jgi:lipid-A-disaccharide synthase
MARLLVSTGEVSGDLQGSLLIRALHEEARRRELPLQVVALGGERMRQAGAELLADTSRLGAIGLLEALPLILPTLRLQRRVRQWLRQHPPEGVVLIDYMGANINLGLRLKRLYPQVPISYYIAPQEWAFRVGDGGTTRLIGFSDRILAIFPEEASFYASRGAAVTWVGHPLIDTLGQPPSRARARQDLGLPEEAPVLLLLPASRPQELRYLLPPMAAAVALLQQRLPQLEVLLPAGLPGFEEALRRALAEAAGHRLGAEQIGGRVAEEVEVGHRAGVAESLGRAAADHERPDEFRDARIPAEHPRDIGQRPQGQDRELPRVGLDRFPDDLFRRMAPVKRNPRQIDPAQAVGSVH